MSQIPNIGVSSRRATAECPEVSSLSSQGSSEATLTEQRRPRRPGPPPPAPSRPAGLLTTFGASRPPAAGVGGDLRTADWGGAAGWESWPRPCAATAAGWAGWRAGWLGPTALRSGRSPHPDSRGENQPGYRRKPLGKTAADAGRPLCNTHAVSAAL